MASSENLASPKQAPPLNIPKSSSTVNVAIMNPSTITLPTKVLTKPTIADFIEVTCPCYSFLIHHPISGRKIVFDLGIRKDWDKGPTQLIERYKKNGFIMDVKDNVVDILHQNGHDPEAIEAVVWSHYHYDHVGDPSTFPKSTKLLVGPGVTKRWDTAWPTKPDAPVDESAWTGRIREEITFDSGLKIGRFEAHDFFGDGSFYLLNTPGHLLGHICGLARTTDDTFIFMGGDAAHHAGEFRPTEYRPLPKRINLDGTSVPRGFPCPCPSELLLEHVHPEKSATKPFYHPSDAINEEPEVAYKTLAGLEEFDADDRVFMIIAHDPSLVSILGFLPETANEWQKKGWQTAGRWRFVTDFAKGLPENGKL